MLWVGSFINGKNKKVKMSEIFHQFGVAESQSTPYGRKISEHAQKPPELG